ncbi:MAG: N-acetyltransferase family protein [Pseudomonadota bacterium]
MLLRPAKATDAAGICAIWNPIIRDTDVTFTTAQKTDAQVADMITLCTAQNRPFLVLDDNGIAGFATYAQFRPGPGYTATMEQTIYLAPAAQGRGLGRQLAAALEDAARRAGIRSLIAGISATNPGAIAFHTACGFTQVGRIPQAGEKGGAVLDLVLLHKLL